MALIYCPECGKQVSDRAKACPECGMPIEEYVKKNAKKICPECGSEVLGSVATCPKCGFPFQSDIQRESVNLTNDENDYSQNVKSKHKSSSGISQNEIDGILTNLKFVSII